MKKQRVLVTGSGGFIGSHLIKELSWPYMNIEVDSNYEPDDRWTKSFKMTKVMFEEVGISHEFIKT